MTIRHFPNCAVVAPPVPRWLSFHSCASAKEKEYAKKIYGDGVSKLSNTRFQRRNILIVGTQRSSSSIVVVVVHCLSN